MCSSFSLPFHQENKKQIELHDALNTERTNASLKRDYDRQQNEIMKLFRDEMN